MSTTSIAGIPARQLATAADDNLAVHASWAQERLPGARVVRDAGLVLVDSGLPCDTFNFVLRSRLDAAAAPARVQEAIDSFRRAGRPFSWWVGPADEPENLGDLLRAAGLEAAESEVAMAADLHAIRADGEPPRGLEIARVTTAAQVRDFARLLAGNWTPPDPDVVRFYERATPALLSGDAPLWLYVGYLEGTPVATSELAVGGGVAGLYNISTIPSYRRRGIGRALTLRPLLDARAAGLRVAILQASADGLRLYEQMGFVATGRITEYKPAGEGAR
ncbi:GNAT family N-acetyltransferase [Sorangium sp. So ce1335]|uniref:GNAT family N-acetyltransferase n=1 Tax=Sorangium sp. So ce1335 TaxID=3133335 RepID=UPI003F5D9159